MLIIGTIGGAVIGSIIIANVHSIWLLVSLFVFISIFYAVKNVNYTLAALFLTPFILVFLNILIPGQTLLAQTRTMWDDLDPNWVDEELSMEEERLNEASDDLNGEELSEQLRREEFKDQLNAWGLDDDDEW
jgi:hypothetical protein